MIPASKQTTSTKKKGKTKTASIPVSPNPFCIPRHDHPEVFLSDEKAKSLLFKLYYTLEQTGQTNLLSEIDKEVWKNLYKVYKLNLKTYKEHMEGKTVDQILEAPEHTHGQIHELLTVFNKPIF